MTAAPPPLPADAPRVADGRYVLLGRLGEGGMAVVYGAWDEDLRIWRAVKVLLPQFARRQSVRRRFEVEAQTLMEIRHPNLVRVIEVNAERALPYLVMDLVPGGSIEEWSLRHGKMPARLATDVAIQICRGLAAVHEAGVVHRDVKPHNVLADTDGTCKLADFGVAQVEGGDTRTGVAMGTVGYMSPEQLADSKSVDARADVYSVGASLYVLLTRSPVRDLFRIAEDPSRLDDVPEPLRPIIATCLQYAREDRYTDMRTLQAALEAALPLLPAIPADTPPLARRPKDGPPGGSPGEFTELMGLLEATRPPPDTSGWVAPDALTPLFAMGRADDATATTEIDPDAPTEAVVVVAPTPAPVSRTHRPLRSTLGGVVILGVLASVLAAIVAGIVVPIGAAAGSARIEAAASTCVEAERILVDRADDVALLQEDLTLIGGRAVASGGGSVAFAERVAEAARPLLGVRPDDPERELARQRLQRVVWAVDHLHHARNDWKTAAESPTGWMAIRAGLALSPPP